MTIQLTIIGLGQIGASVGLALKDNKNEISCAGYDQEIDFARQAQKMGAVNKVFHSLPACVKKADVVLLALPEREVAETLKVIATELKPGAVVLDCSLCQTAAIRRAQELLPENCSFATFTPTLNPNFLHEIPAGVRSARAELFQNSLVAIACPGGATKNALKPAADLATLLGASPFFADPAEMDGLATATHILPQLAAAALLQSTTSQPGWQEGRKIAGSSYALGIAPVTQADVLSTINNPNVVRVLDGYIAALQNFRQLIAENNVDVLGEILKDMNEERFQWIGQRTASGWNAPPPAPEVPTTGETFKQMFVGNWGRKKP